MALPERVPDAAGPSVRHRHEHVPAMSSYSCHNAGEACPEHDTLGVSVLAPAGVPYSTVGLIVIVALLLGAAVGALAALRMAG